MPEIISISQNKCVIRNRNLCDHVTRKTNNFFETITIEQMIEHGLFRPRSMSTKVEC